MASLHEYISAEILPPEYEGRAEEVSKEWLFNELYAAHNEYVKNSYYGYSIKPDGSNLTNEDNVDTLKIASDTFSNQKIFGCADH